MKRPLWRTICLVNIFLGVCLLRADGFAVDNFYVGVPGIVVNNMEPSSAATMIVTLAATYPPAAVAVALGEAVALGVASFIAYRAYKKSQRSNKKIDGCFSLNDKPELANASGSYVADISKIDSVIGCGIAEDQAKTAEVIPYVNPEDISGVYSFPIAIVEQPILCASAAENDCEENKQYPGPWYNRTEDWINEHSFGKKIKQSLERSKYTNQGKRAFKVIKNIESCDGFKKGDLIVIDAMHKDHLEVFDKRGKWVGVANFDGTKNNDKTKQGEKESRGELQ